jgi:hypothetical protein
MGRKPEVLDDGAADAQGHQGREVQPGFRGRAGEGDQRSDLESLAAELGLRERVAFLGRCDAARMDAAYAACHILVLPSRVPENSPLTVLEAGARGRPSIAPAAGGVPELLADARGWTFPSEDVAALARALTMPHADMVARRNTHLRFMSDNYLTKWARWMLHDVATSRNRVGLTFLQVGMPPRFIAVGGTELNVRARALRAVWRRAIAGACCVWCSNMKY